MSNKEINSYEETKKMWKSDVLNICIQALDCPIPLEALGLLVKMLVNHKQGHFHIDQLCEMSGLSEKATHYLLSYLNGVGLVDVDVWYTPDNELEVFYTFGDRVFDETLLVEDD